MSNTTHRQPWISRPVYDTVFILLPPFAALLAVWLLPAEFKTSAAMPVAAWVLLVLFIDVAHVYSTLYNTYFDKGRLRRHNRLFLLIPIACYAAGVALHLFSGLLFWRVLAYLAVFHFIRQQYGFMRLYARKDNQHTVATYIDAATIYAATLYPLIYWHCTPGRNFNWFIDGDFVIGSSDQVKRVAGIIYLLIVAGYVIKECIIALRRRYLNLPKNLVITGTLVSWYFGIIYFNGDMAFTLLNVVSHGIPYMALIWAEMKKADANKSEFVPVPARLSARWYGVLIFIGSLVLLAYLEEGLWDGMVWQDHKGVFALFNFLPHVSSSWLLALLVPLLSLPQSTHYVLDGFIWRKKYR